MAQADLNQAIQSTLVIASNEYKYVAEVETAFGELPLVNCYAGEINQVVLNLIVNAAHAIGDVVKGTQRQGQDPRIDARARRANRNRHRGHRQGYSGRKCARGSSIRSSPPRKSARARAGPRHRAQRGGRQARRHAALRDRSAARARRSTSGCPSTVRRALPRRPEEVTT